MNLSKFDIPVARASSSEECVPLTRHLEMTQLLLCQKNKTALLRSPTRREAGQPLPLLVLEPKATDPPGQPLLSRRKLAMQPTVLDGAETLCAGKQVPGAAGRCSLSLELHAWISTRHEPSLSLSAP